jgi:hypothetical protein
VKIFQQRELQDAFAHVAAGGQALHLMSGLFAYLRRDTPRCFKGRAQIAHLFDQDRDRLISTARKLGVRVIKVERDGARGQHIDLCGQPLNRAISMAAEEITR